MPKQMIEPDFLNATRVREQVASTLKSTDLREFDAHQQEITDFVRESVTAVDLPELREASMYYAAQSVATGPARSLSRLRTIARIACGLIELCCLTVIVSVASGSSTIYPFWWLTYTPPFQVFVGQTLAAALTVALTGLASQFALEASIQRGARTREYDIATEKATEANFKARDAVKSAIESAVRRAVNTLDFDGMRLRDLDARTAPALVELNDYEFVNAEGLQRVVDFIENHSTSAIGIAGTRGIGKSTIMKRVCRPTDQDVIGVYLQTPVFYSAVDFVKMLHAEVARSILRDSGEILGERALATNSQRALPQIVVAGSAALVGLLLFTIDVLTAGPSSFFKALSPLGAGGVVVTAAAFLWVVALAPQRSPLHRVAREGSSKSVRLAARHLERLEWTSTVASGSKLSLKLASTLTAENDSRSTLTERSKSHPELVSEFRNFLTQYRELDGKKIIVAVDELDKMANGEDAVALVNGMKDLFHVEETHFLVSVSEDALASFALRGVPVRDVFDSTFDDVVRISAFTFRETQQLLQQRVVKFPHIATVLCHVVAGGLPREVLRTARRCVEIRRGATGPVSGDDLAASVVTEEVLEILAGYSIRHPERAYARTSLALSRAADAIRSAKTPQEGLREIIKTNDTPRSSPVDEDESWRRLPLDLLAVSAVLRTAGEVVQHAVDRNDWKTFIVSEELAKVAEELAALRRRVGGSPRGALEGVAALRLRLGFPDLN